MLVFRSLLEEYVYFWRKALKTKRDFDEEGFLANIRTHEIDLSNYFLCLDSREVATAVSGFIAKEFTTRSNCIK